MARGDPLIIRKALEFREALLRRDAAQMQEMVTRWMAVERDLQGAFDLLVAEALRMSESGETPSVWQVFQIERYRSMVAQVQAEISRYADTSVGQISATQREFAALGIEHGADLIRAGYETAGVNVGEFARISPAAVEHLVGFAGNGSPLRDMLTAAFPEAANGIVNELVRGLTRGWGPVRIASNMANGLGLGLQRMMVIARTEQLRAYREATRAEYKESGVVVGYRRLAAKSGRTCVACLFADGRFYSLDVPFEEHPNGRCTQVPVIINTPPITWQTGQEWFKTLSASGQREMLGRGVYNAWKAGSFTLDDIVKRHESEEWGASLVPRPLKELLELYAA